MCLSVAVVVRRMFVPYWAMGGWETAVVAEASLTLVAVARLVQTDVVTALAPLAEVSGKMLRW